MMSGIQPEDGSDLCAPIGIAPAVTVTATMRPEAAFQLAQFAKRSTFDTFYRFTEAHLSNDERTARAYQMIAGIEAVGRALADAGYAPR